jgi:hypothetical protein
VERLQPFLKVQIHNVIKHHPFQKVLSMCSRYKDIYLYSCYISAFLSYVVLSVLTVIIPSRLGEASKGKAYSSDKGGKGSSSHAVPTKSDAELKLELGQFPQ